MFNLGFMQLYTKGTPYNLAAVTMGLSANAPHSRGLSSRCVTTTRRAGLAVRPTTCTIFARKHSLPLVAKDVSVPTSLPPALAGVRMLAEGLSFPSRACAVSSMLLLPHITGICKLTTVTKIFPSYWFILLSLAAITSDLAL